MLFRVTGTVVDTKVWFIEADSEEEFEKKMDAIDYWNSEDEADFDSTGPEYDYKRVK